MRLKVGADGDISIFDSNRVIDKATFEILRSIPGSFVT
jgi:hypothetical protein